MTSFHPSVIPEAAIWRGKPTKERIDRIEVLRTVDSQGRVYWRSEIWKPWRRLTGASEFAAFNKALENSY